MKFTLIVLSLLITFSAVSVLTRAEEQSDKSAAAAAAPATAPATAPSTQSSAIFNKKCPISGDPVDPKGETYTYKGKKIGFCCPDCIGDFKKDPEKYMKTLK